MVNAEIKRELIMPSSPTPPHLKNLQLSFLDQCAPPVYIHIILYFQAPANGENSGETSRRLKQSLSEALAVYYPLAGRLQWGNTAVKCNDAGAEYYEAQFKERRIMDIIESSEIEELTQYVPAAPSGGGDIPLAVQVSFFGDGGIAIGFCMSHSVADARSMVMFANTWAAINNQDPKCTAFTQPTFDLSWRFSPVDFSTFFDAGDSSRLPPPTPPQKIFSKRFAFDEQKLMALKKATSGSRLENPTRVEAVSAFIWRSLIANNSTNKTTMFAAAHAVDIVHRASPSLPPLFFGNACARAMAMAATTESLEYCNLAVKFREAIGKIDGNYVRKLENGEDFLREYSVSEENDPRYSDGRRRLEVCCFTSWWRLPAYEVDYGWGMPEWVSIIGVPLKNLVLLLRTRTGEGIEAWVNMAEEDVGVMEKNYRLLEELVTLPNGHKHDK